MVVAASIRERNLALAFARSSSSFRAACRRLRRLSTFFSSSSSDSELDELLDEDDEELQLADSYGRGEAGFLVGLEPGDMMSSSERLWGSSTDMEPGDLAKSSSSVRDRFSLRERPSMVGNSCTV